MLSVGTEEQIISFKRRPDFGKVWPSTENKNSQRLLAVENGEKHRGVGSIPYPLTSLSNTCFVKIKGCCHNKR